MNPSNKDSLGDKINLVIDKENPFLAKYKFDNEIIEKVDGDETRFQLLGKNPLPKGRSYF